MELNDGFLFPQVLDNTYEHFVYGGRKHSCVGGANVINIFSFSKAYGMMGWRMGYLAYSAEGGIVRKRMPCIVIRMPRIAEYPLRSLHLFSMWTGHRRPRSCRVSQYELAVPRIEHEALIAAEWLAGGGVEQDTRHDPHLPHTDQHGGGAGGCGGGPGLGGQLPSKPSSVAQLVVCRHVLDAL